MQTALMFLAVATTACAASGPCLFFPADRIDFLRDNLGRDPSLRTRWEALIRQADEELDRPFMSFEEGFGAPGKGGRFNVASQQMEKSSFILGLAWRVTGEEKYAAKLRDLLLHTAGYESWVSATRLEQDPPWHSELWTAKFTFGSAAGYEAVFDFLSVEDRRRVASAIIENGIEPIMRDWLDPHTRSHALDSMGHNYYAIHVAGAGVGALAVYATEPRAAAWVDAVESALTQWFDYRGMVLLNKTRNFDPAGGYYESLHYANFALTDVMKFYFARNNLHADGLAPVDLPLELDGVPAFFVQTLYPRVENSLGLQFGDSYYDHPSLSVPLLAAEGRTPALGRWYLEHTTMDASDPLVLLAARELAVDARNGLPTSVVYPEIGWAVWRNSWADDATMLAVRCGPTWNHAHADAGTFEFYHHGQRLLIDSGMSVYGTAAYRNYYRESRAHSVVLFNGEGQHEEDVHERGGKFSGQLLNPIDGLGLKYLCADATGPMARHFRRDYRNFLWIDGVIIVYDDLLAFEPGRFDWLLHYAGEARYADGQVDVTVDDARVAVKMLYPQVPVVTEQEGHVYMKPDEIKPYFVLSTSTPAIAQKFVVAIVPEPAPAQVKLIEGSEMLGVEVRSDDYITEVYFNLRSDGRRMHRNSNNVIAGWETDAYMLALTRPVDDVAGATPANVTRYFVGAGSYLRYDGQIVLDTLSKVTTTFQPGPTTVVFIDGQPTIDVRLPDRDSVRSLQVNGEDLPFVARPSERTIRFTMRGPERVTARRSR